MSEKDWLVESLNVRHRQNADRATIEAQMGTVFQNVGEAVKRLAQRYASLPGGEPVQCSAADGTIMVVSIFEQAKPPALHTERERITIRLHREPPAIVASYANGAPDRAFELGLHHSGSAIVKFQGQTLTVDQAAQRILHPALFPDVPESTRLG